MRRSFLLALLAALVAAPAASAGTPVFPSLSRIDVGPARIPDRVLTSSSADVPFGSWGGLFTAKDGEQVTIYISNQYPVDLALPQHWADFLTSLVHGSELSALTMYLASPADITAYCGPGALGCYDPSRSFLIAPGETTTPDLTPEAIVTHEYGHHIAEHRSNPPWTAIAWGTKRWATYMGVCRKTRRHQLYPGAEATLLYTLNPGEGFAESYRVLNQRLLGLAESPWDVVDQALYPTQQALNLLREDVLQPWHPSPARTIAGTLARVHTYTISTPEDGTLSLRVASHAHVRLTVFVNGKRTASGGSSLQYTVCGSRSAKVRVTSAARGGSFRLSYSTA